MPSISARVLCFHSRPRACPRKPASRPRLRRAFPGLPWDLPHLDLAVAGRHVGLRGGLKSIERRLGWQRPGELAGLDDVFAHGGLRCRGEGTAGAAAGGEARLADAVRKATAFPAERFGLVRGRIEDGAVADLLVISPDFEEGATYREPTAYPRGIELVVVAGEVALREGEPTPARAGIVLRR